MLYSPNSFGTPLASKPTNADGNDSNASQRQQIEQLTTKAAKTMMGDCNFSLFHNWSGGWMWHTAWIALLVVIAGAVVWFLLGRSKEGTPNADKADSLEILKLRLARGEITTEDYDTLKSVLQAHQ